LLIHALNLEKSEKIKILSNYLELIQECQTQFEIDKNDVLSLKSKQLIFKVR